ncbi:protein phosphatase 2C domain-containing protein [Kitasatospora kifunensis]|uniref:PPM-type phosphatase domain-containing protein n=1 Tax=Kitasatospora kifunensis TaxID=58351 RepID=A0A7W7R8U5_KITKI|nr:protein phosphatase 2C domain-containing protein [Kitasatospora kifunensis]MBB4927562.1 hypothetical protein [Kitasatospora kifunensis]
MRAPAGRIVAGAVVQGTSHLATGRGCQDAFRAASSPDGSALILAVADGAGSRERSALGAHLAVDVACRLLAADPPSADAGPAEWAAWLGERAGAVLDAYLLGVRALLGAEGQGSGAGEGSQGPAGAAEEGTLAAALAAALVRPPWVAFLQVGDCFGAVLTRQDGEQEQCRLALPAQHPADFLSTPGARDRVVTSVLHERWLSGVVLATDGCAPLALDHPSVLGLPVESGPLPSPRFFQPLAAALRANGGNAEPLRALLSGPQAARSGDDLTVLCALSPGGGPWS